MDLFQDANHMDFCVLQSLFLLYYLVCYHLEFWSAFSRGEFLRESFLLGFCVKEQNFRGPQCIV